MKSRCRTIIYTHTRKRFSQIGPSARCTRSTGGGEGSPQAPRPGPSQAPASRGPRLPAGLRSPRLSHKLAAGRAGAPSRARRAPHPMAPSAPLPLGASPPRLRLHPHLTPPAAAAGGGQEPQARHGAASPARGRADLSPPTAREGSKGPSPPPGTPLAARPAAPRGRSGGSPRPQPRPGPSRAAPALTRRTEPRTTSETLCRSSAAVPGLLSARVNFRVSGATSAMAASALLRPGPPAALTARPPGGPSRCAGGGEDGGRPWGGGRGGRPAGWCRSRRRSGQVAPPPRSLQTQPRGAGRRRGGRLARPTVRQRGGAARAARRGPAPTCSRGAFLIGLPVTCPAAPPNPHWLSEEPRPR